MILYKKYKMEATVTENSQRKDGEMIILDSVSTIGLKEQQNVKSCR